MASKMAKVQVVVLMVGGLMMTNMLLVIMFIIYTYAISYDVYYLYLFRYIKTKLVGSSTMV